MAKFGYVWLYPDAGKYGKQWAKDPAEDAFVRCSRRVTERYSEPLDSLGLQALRWSQKISVVVPAEVVDRVVVDVHHLPGREHVVHAHVPSSVLETTPQERARLVLEVVDAAMHRIGMQRGWPTGALEVARRHALDHHLEFEMSGPWTLNPTGERKVRVTARIADDGWSDLGFEVADRASGEPLGFTRTVRSPSNAQGKFLDTVSDFRWADSTTLERPDQWKIQSGASWGGVVSFDIADLRPWPHVVRPVPLDPPLPVEVRETDHRRGRKAQ